MHKDRTVELPLSACAEYLVSENRNSDLPVAERLKIQKKTFYGKVLGRLFFFHWPGALLFLLFSISRRERVRQYRGMVLADHSSRVIDHALARAWGRDYKNEREQFATSRASLAGVYLALLRHRGYLKEAFQAANVQHVTEYIRLVRLFHFYLVWKAWFKKNRPTAVLIARTNDQNRLALGVVAQEEGVPLGAFTVARVTLQRQLPFSVHTAFCWTSRQAREYKAAGVSALRMPVPVLKNVKLPVPEPGKGRYGLLLNAKIDTEKLDAWLEELFRLQGIDNLHIRPHPGFNEEKLSRISRGKICDWRQPLSEYLEELDLAFAVNSHAVIDALLHGIPVVYLGGLDPYEYDLHGYVKDGIVIPWEEVKEFPASVDAFYSSRGFRERWNTDEFETSPRAEQEAVKELAGGSLR